MRTKIWVVAAANGERGEEPCFPAVFGTAEAAEAHADQEMRSEWEAWGPIDDETGIKAEYPGDWRAAQDVVIREVADGSWGRYEITSHEVDVVDTSDPPYDEVVQMLDDVSAALRNLLVTQPGGSDFVSRWEKARLARELCDRLLRPEPESEDDRST